MDAHYTKKTASYKSSFGSQSEGINMQTCPLQKGVPKQRKSARTFQFFYIPLYRSILLGTYCKHTCTLLHSRLYYRPTIASQAPSCKCKCDWKWFIMASIQLPWIWMTLIRISFWFASFLRERVLLNDHVRPAPPRHCLRTLFIYYLIVIWES